MFRRDRKSVGKAHAPLTRITAIIAVVLVGLMLIGCPSSDRDSEGPVLLSTMVVPTTTAPTVTLTLANQSTETICFVYVAPAGSGEWGESLLVGGVIVPGGVGTFEVPPGMYDLRASNCFDVPLAEKLTVDIFEPLGWRIVRGDSPW